ncbi:MAG: T9SS type A sorting domain-containing protein [Candidatus Marinimicrobia bacterium]|nr:T9SS type A sorting domain-containing protein [Candidatus Neomarinimicrobiota bacterium]MCF7851121.1 T9SS type A sorting domain-containing protein [Candidatus Neomarinimicrobiota bacterium]MCF7904331.1 T9SS type A sorting domain-containing protein [Candidatus Neomarinimicrobiota bacterium]
MKVATVIGVLIPLLIFGQNPFPPPENFTLEWYYQMGNYFNLSWDSPDISNTNATLSGYHIYRNLVILDTLPSDSIFYQDIQSPPLDGETDWKVYYFLTAIYTNPTGESVTTDTLKHVASTIATDDNFQAIPLSYSVFQSYPNPFNPSTTISYDLPEHSHVNLTIYNVLGRAVVMLQEEERPAGHYEAQWYGTDALGNQVSTGVYFARLQAGALQTNGVQFSETIKLVYVK